ncbi:UNVERIFIED_CONTAM: hypothetical protein GTU68_043439 [Idotea baltica]|nr:hypothetical protein [Idotea baltica]
MFSLLAAGLKTFNDYRQSHTQCNLEGTVVKVVDGDSITVLDDEKIQHRVRLAGIDAPERKQAYGKASTQFLADRVAGKMVCVGWYKRDKYQRLVGVVRINNQVMNLALVEAGLAWHYKHYQSEQTESEREDYADAEEDARAARRGLWSDRNPTSPWAWRKAKYNR